MSIWRRSHGKNFVVDIEIQLSEQFPSGSDTKLEIVSVRNTADKVGPIRRKYNPACVESLEECDFLVIVRRETLGMNTSRINDQQVPSLTERDPK
jgi:hypothetical protein